MATTPFDLNQAVLDWKRRLADSPAFRRDHLDELEAHLRDSVVSLQEAGLAADEAFFVAARRLGSPDSMATEFAKVHPGEERHWRAGWMTLGVILWWIVHDLAHVLTGAFWLGGHALDLSGTALAWMGITVRFIVLGLAAAAFLRFMFSDQPLSDAAATPAQRRPPLPRAGAMIALMVVLAVASALVPIALASSLNPAKLGTVYAFQPGFRAIENILFVALTVVIAVRLGAPLRSHARLASLLLVAAVTGLLPWTTPRAGAQSATPRLHAAAATSTAPASLTRALELWQADKKAEAFDQFMAIDFSRRPVFPKGSTLGYSEREFMALPRAVNEKLQPQIVAQMGPLKALAVHAKETAQAAQARGDRARADACLAQIRACGNALAGPDSLALVQAVGRAFQRLGTTSTNAPAKAPTRRP